MLSDLTGSGKSLIQESYSRLGLPASHVCVVTVSDMVAPIAKQLKLPKENFFVDPVRRGTWPAILWAVGHLHKRNPDALIAVVTGDHVIQGELPFRKTMQKALAIAESRPAIVMLGIAPSREPSDWQSFGVYKADDAGAIRDFEEKPSIEQAKRMINSKGYAWNSGMFFFRVSTAEAVLKRYQPVMYGWYLTMAAAITVGNMEQAARIFEQFPEKIPHPLDPSRLVDNSIDYAIMAPLVHRPDPDLEARSVQANGFKWTDLGRWDSLRQVLKADGAGNIKIGKVTMKKDVRGSILVAQDGYRIEAAGIENAVVAFANDEALVLSQAALPKIKEIVSAAQKRPHKVILEEGSVFKVERKGKQLFVSGRNGLIQ